MRRNKEERKEARFGVGAESGFGLEGEGRVLRVREFEGDCRDSVSPNPDTKIHYGYRGNPTGYSILNLSPGLGLACGLGHVGSDSPQVRREGIHARLG